MSMVWLITSGSSGLGLSLGRCVLDKGRTVVLTTRNLAKARATAPDIEEKGGKWLQLDFADTNVTQVVEDAVRRWEVDVLVDNAGYPLSGPIESCRYVRDFVSHRIFD